MSNAISSYDVIHNNPFIFAPILAEFYRDYPERPNSILLSYLVLPLVLPIEARKVLAKANKTSTVATFLRRKNVLAGLGERINEYRELTNQSLRYAVDVGLLSVGSDLAVKVIGAECDFTFSPEAAPRASRRLGIMFSPYDIPTIYRTFGIRKL